MSHDRFIVEDRPSEQRYVLLDTEGAGRTAGDPEPQHDTARSIEAGEIAYVDVASPSEPGERVLFHTAIHDAYAGQGLAGVLVRAALDDVIAQGLRIVPVCPYIAAWLPKHPEYSASVTQARADHLAAVRARQR